MLEHHRYKMIIKNSHFIRQETVDETKLEFLLSYYKIKGISFLVLFDHRLFNRGSMEPKGVLGEGYVVREDHKSKELHPFKPLL
jgi:hypothetical protein